MFWFAPKKFNPVSRPNLVALSVYIFLLGIGLRFSTSIGAADLLLPLFIAQLLAYYGLHKYSWQSILAFLLIAYTLTGATVLAFSHPSMTLYPLALAFRMTVFIVSLSYAAVAAHTSTLADLRCIRHSCMLFISFSLLITCFNLISGSKAYYGYSQILFSSSPAISAFVLAASSIYLFFSYSELTAFAEARSSLFFSLLGIMLALGTLSLSSFASVIAGLATFFAMKLFMSLKLQLRLQYNRIKKFNVLLALAFPFIAYALWATGLIDIGYRLARIFGKLDYRLQKSSQILESCSDLICNLFGSGPGYHSMLIGSVPGEQSVLAYDQLYGRLIFEWGLVGSLLLVLALLYLLYKGPGLSFYVPSPSFAGFIVFGLAFGVGSEFIFVSPSGALYASFVGLVSSRWARFSATPETNYLQ